MKLLYIFNLFVIIPVLLELAIHNNYCYIIYIKKINKNLEHDYRIYKDCVNYSNQISCGRKNSTIKKNNKPSLKYLKKYLVKDLKCKVITYDTTCQNIKKMLIIIGIATGPEYYIERHVFRLYYNKYNFLKYFFFMGKSDNDSINIKLQKENDIYHDMIIFNFISSYYNLTTQTICAFDWLESHCNIYKWYIHQTSDTFLNISSIYMYLKDFHECKCVIGNILKNVHVQKKNDIFSIPYNEVKLKIYPDYPSGAGYFLHHSAVKEINRITKEIYPKVWIDDAFIGIVLSFLNITLIDKSRYFHVYGKIKYSNIYKYMLVHGLSPSEIYFLSKYIQIYVK